MTMDWFLLSQHLKEIVALELGGWHFAFRLIPNRERSTASLGWNHVWLTAPLNAEEGWKSSAIRILIADEGQFGLAQARWQ